MKTVFTNTILGLCLAVLTAGCTDSNSKTTVSSSSTNNGSATTNSAPSHETPAKNAEPTETPDPMPGDGEVPLPNDGEEKGPVTLAIGKPAPALKVAHWVKGEPVKSFQPGQVYVVEFWATWCPPCRQSMPHLSKLQAKYGERVRLIGVTDEDEPTVREFLKENQQPGKTWDQAVQYTLALDDGEGTNRAYMRAAGQSGIPTAFVVGKDGVVEWIGHPMEMDEPLEKIVTGEWDRNEAAAEAERAAAKKIALRKALTDLRRAQEAGDDEKVLAIADSLVELGVPADQVRLFKVNLLSKAGKTEEAAKLVTELVDESQSNAELLNGIAMGIVAEGLPGGLELALKAAKRAVELTEEKDASSLDTLAKVYSAQGNRTAAIAAQKKAVALAPEDEALSKTLKQYEEAKDEPKEAPKDEPKEQPKAEPKEQPKDAPKDEPKPASKEESKEQP